ncbi:MAG: hypothetical protein MJ179_05980 [Treponema sp.]|nr:hypothetical protein [Treponema sp.]
MDSNISFIDNFSSHLFWDTDRSQLDFTEHKDYIIKQVLEFGYDKDWKLLKQKYSINQIKESAMNARTLDKKAASFIACLTNTNIKDFRCYTTTHSNSLHWNY